MQQGVLINNNSHGLGEALSLACSEGGWQVYGLGQQPAQDNLHDGTVRLCSQQEVAMRLDDLLGGVGKLDIVYLNSIARSELNTSSASTTADMQNALYINVWSSKLVLDHLLNGDIVVRQVIGLCATTKPPANKALAASWLSGIGLNKLLEHYAMEYADTHFTSLACAPVDKLVGFEDLPMTTADELISTTQELALSILEMNTRLLDLPSGSCIDLHSLSVPATD